MALSNSSNYSENVTTPVNMDYNDTTEYLTKPFENYNSQCLGSKNIELENERYSPAASATIITLTTVFCAVGLIGNIIVIIAIIKDHVISKHHQHLYLLSLAVADALLVVLVVPFTLTNELLGEWPFGEVYCRIYLSVDILLCTASICNICCIGIDRFVSVKYPTTYRKYRTKPKIRLAIIFVWTYAAAVSLLPFFGKTDIIHGYKKECFINDSSWFILTSTSLSFFLPACIIGPVYVKIYFVGRELEAKKRARYVACHPEPDVTRSPPNLIKGKNNRKASVSWREDCKSKMCNKYLKDNKDTASSCGILTRSTSLQERCFNSASAFERKRSMTVSIDGRSVLKRNHLLAPPTDQWSPKIHPRNCSEFLPKHIQKMSTETCTETSEVDTSDKKRTSSSNKTNISGNGKFSSPNNHRLDSICTNPIGSNDTKTSLFSDCFAKIQRKNSKSDNGQIHSPLFSRSDIDIDSAKSSQKRHNSISSIVLQLRRVNSPPRRPSALSTVSACTGPSRREKRFIFIITVVTGCFLLCWTPFFTTYAIYAICRQCCINQTLFKVFFWTGYLNSGINPVLYTIFNNDFRRAFKRLIRMMQSDGW